MDFHTPPLAAPTYTVSRPSSLTAAMAETRPLMAADPIFRAPRPEMVSESNFAPGSCAGDAATQISTADSVTRQVMRYVVQRMELRIWKNSFSAELCSQLF